MKKKIVMLMGIVCMLTATAACGGQKETNTDTVVTETPQPVTSGDSTITDGDSAITSGDSQLATEHQAEELPTDQSSEDDSNKSDENTEGAVTDPPTYSDVKTDEALGEITITKVSEDISRVPVVIRDIDPDRLRLLVRGYNEEAKNIIGEACFVSSEGAKVTNMDGAELEFSDLQPGNIIYVEISGVLESDPSQSSTENIILIQK